MNTGVLFTIVVVAFAGFANGESLSGNVYRTTVELITSRGYPAETHTVYTEDGHGLTLHRIPHGKQQPTEGTERPAVFLLHGMLDSSSSWVLQDESHSLGFVLADRGYDVWMGNVRGNRYSNFHKTLSKGSVEYWAFSLDEMARYDLPTMVDKVLEVSGQPKVSVVAHGQGTLLLFMSLSLYKEELTKKLSSMSLLAPLAYLNHQSSLLLEGLSKMRFDLIDRYSWLKFGEFLPTDSWLTAAAATVCHALPFPCNNIMWLLWGANHAPMHHIDPKLIPEMMAHIPGGTSTSVMAHYVQLERERWLDTGKLVMYDFGTAANLKKYGQHTPPEYSLSEAKVPMLLFSGGADDIANSYDVELIFSNVPKEFITSQFRHEDTYCHLDFAYAKDASIIVYPHVVNHIEANLGASTIV